MTKSKETGGGSTTLSTRFDEKEMEFLRKAAAARQWSLSQLIRIGAVEKAVHIANTKSAALPAVRRVLAAVTEHLLNTDGICMEDGEKAKVAPLDKDVWAGFIRSLRSLGAELEPLLEAEHERISKGSAEDWTFGALIEPKAITSSIPSQEAGEPSKVKHGEQPSQAKKKGPSFTVRLKSGAGRKKK